ncbi:MAG: alpha-glucosidase family protein [Rhodobacteraceae bacterium]|nr:alpha-glucosidase family protein [Paracoccaceae bacterium]
MASDWWRGAVIYQIYPRSFQDDNGDGVGDLAGITRRLDHVAELGADAIWLSPFFPSPMKDMGYDVADYRGVDPLFGSLQDFDALLAHAHELGLKVIIDQVLSHSSDQHEWFKESRTSRDNPKADWYVWADPSEDGTPPNNWQSVFGGAAWEWEPRRHQYFLHNFLTEQPDLNLWNPEVQDALLGEVQFWLDRGVDGFRLDVANFYFHDIRLRNNPPAPAEDRAQASETYGHQQHIHDKNQPEVIAFLTRLRKLTDRYDDTMVVGEISETGDKALELMGDYTAGPDRLHMAYSFELLGPNFSAGHFRRNVEQFFAAAPDSWPCWSFSNHDCVRHVSRWADHGASSDALARQSIALLCALEGNVGLYQGEELGQLESDMEYHELTDPPGLRFWPEVKGRDGCRTPMVWEADAQNAGFSEATPWLPVKAPQQARSVDAQEAANDSVLHAYRESLSFRRSSEAMRRGRTTFLDAPEPILAFRRGEDQTCIFNLSPEPVVVRLAGPAEITGPSACALEDGTLNLPGNGFAYLTGAPTFA